jgi:hypothetical protein
MRGQTDMSLIVVAIAIRSPGLTEHELWRSLTRQVNADAPAPLFGDARMRPDTAWP